VLGIGPLQLAERLSSAGVDARPIWPPLHTVPMYHDAVVLGRGVAEHLFSRGLSLPSSTNLSVADQDRVISSLIDAIGPT
jgi:pyridoxal phosphate-dependent aminotransferase EpsN